MAQETLQHIDGAKEPYPWHLFWRTLPLLGSWILTGLTDGLKGPTILDLTDHYKVSIGDISFILMLSSIGALAGSILVGLTLDKLTRYRYLVVSGQLAIFGVSFLMFPLFNHVAGLYTVSFFAGLGYGALDAAGQVLLLDIWRGRDSGPYMHCLHFMYGVGAFLGPLVARPFLSNTEEVDINILSFGEASNTTNIVAISQDADVGTMFRNDSIWTIQFLYPMIGVLPLLPSTAFVIYFIIDERKNKPVQKEEKTKKEEENTLSFSNLIGYKSAVLVTMMLFYFLYIGQEVAFGTFIPVFAVESKLGLSRQQGSDLAAVFWAMLAGTRGLAVPAAIFLQPEVIMIISFVASIVGAVFLSIYGDSNVQLLFGFTALLGFGMASIFATGLLWLEKRITITNRIGSAMAISYALGGKIFPVLVGHVVEHHPMHLMYITLGISASCVLLFVVATLLSRKLKQEEEEKAKDDRSTTAHENPQEINESRNS